MPTRYLKPGIRDSEAINRLKPATETLFYRLIVTVDDFGRTDARPAMVKAACFPIKDECTAGKCAEMLDELAEHGLIELYTVEGKPYLQMHRWDNSPRAKESKFPAPSGERAHLHADARKPRTVLPVTVTGTGTETDIPPTPRRGEGERFDEFWQAWPKGERKQDKAKCLDHWKRNQLDQHADAILADVRTKRGTRKWQEGFIEAPLVYLRGKRWQDGVEPEAEGGSEPLDWRQSAAGIVAKGEELGLGRWTEDECTAGRMPNFPTFKARVLRAADEAEGRAHPPETAPDPEGMKRVAALLGQALGKAKAN